MNSLEVAGISAGLGALRLAKNLRSITEITSTQMGAMVKSRMAADRAATKKVPAGRRPSIPMSTRLAGAAKKATFLTKNRAARAMGSARSRFANLMGNR